MRPSAFSLPLALIALLGAPSPSVPSPEDPPETTSRHLTGLQQLVLDGRYEESEAEARELLAENDPDGTAETAIVAEALMYLSQTLWRAGRVFEQETEETALRSIRIQEELRGFESPELAEYLMNAAALYYRRSDMNRSQEYAQRILDILEKAGLADDPRAAGAHNILSLVLWLQGDLDAALVHMERTVVLLEKKFGPDHSQVAMMTQNIGWILSQKGRYDESRVYLGRAADTWRRIGLTEHPEYARCLVMLGQLDWYAGNYADARREYESALAIQEASLAEDHPDLAHSLAGLGRVYRDTHDLERAEEYYHRAIAIRQAALGENHYDLIWDYLGLAEVLARRGNVSAARGQAEQALARLQAPGSGSVLRGITLERLALLDVAAGDLTSARELAEEARSTFEREGLRRELADTEYVLGRIDFESQDHSGARAHFERAASLAESVGGADHPALTPHLTAWSAAAFLDGDPAEAFTLAMRAENISREHVRATAREYEEHQALTYAGSRISGLDLALSYLADTPIVAGETAALDAVVRSRALVFDEIAARQLAFRDADDPEVDALARQLAEARERLANLLVRGSTEDPARHEGSLASALRERDDAERRLAERSLVFRAKTERRDLGFEDVQSYLGPRDALVSYVRFQRFAAEPLPQPAYCAFVYGDGTGPVVVPIETEATVERLVEAWRHEAARGELDPTRSPKQAERAYRAAGEALRQAVWDPVAPYLASSDRVFVVPEGALHLVSFSALPVDGDHYLVEEPVLVQVLSAERDLVPWRAAGSGDGLLAFGGPAFDETVQSVPVPGPVFRGSPSKCVTLRGLHFEPLAGAAREVEEIVAAWKGGRAEARTGVEASESAFKREAPGSHVLHIATHGFFLTADCELAGATAQETASGRDMLDENPLLLSGLALAGANRRDAIGPEEEDGILTAEEILAVDLQGVEWVVLSACDTGLGKIEVGEGVLGLRRAFLSAGVETVIMSLWSVEDEATRRWMTTLYDHRFGAELSTGEAVRRASLGSLRERRSRGLSTHPFYWGAFVAVGPPPPPDPTGGRSPSAP